MIIDISASGSRSRAKEKTDSTPLDLAVHFLSDRRQYQVVGPLG
jgi:hypothetical protein